MHSRCDDKAIHIYLGWMVKQATKHGSMSSISMKEAVARSESLPKIRAQSCQDNEQGLLGLFSPCPGGMPRGVKKSIIDPTMY